MSKLVGFIIEIITICKNNYKSLKQNLKSKSYKQEIYDQKILSPD